MNEHCPECQGDPSYVYKGDGFVRSCITCGGVKPIMRAMSVDSAGPQVDYPALTDEQKVGLEASLGFADEGLSGLLLNLPANHRCVAALEGAKRAVRELYAEVEGD